MKGEITLKILEFLEEAATTAVDLGFALAGGGSITQVQREFGRRHFRRGSKVEELEKSARKRNNFCKLLYKLKKEGLIAENKNSHFLSVTAKGRKSIDLLKMRASQKLPPNIYEKENDNKFRVIIFDIPESQRRKRNWLRSVLVSLDFTMLQKSVWAGKNKIPKDLLENLEELEISPFVEIFEISKAGSIKSVSEK